MLTSGQYHRNIIKGREGQHEPEWVVREEFIVGVTHPMKFYLLAEAILKVKDYSKISFN